MQILLVTLHVIVCLMLILVILLQVGRGHGLSGASFGSGNVQSVFGMKTSAFLSKATTISAIIFICTTITLDIIQVQKSRSLFQTRHRGTEEKIDVEKMKQALERIKQEAQKQEAKARLAAQDVKKTSVSEEAAKKEQVAVTGSISTQAKTQKK